MKFGLSDRLTILGLKLFSHPQVRIDIEAAIKRILFEVELVNKEEWKPFKLIFKDITGTLVDCFNKQVFSVFRKICEFKKDDKVVNLTKRQLQEMTEPDAEKYLFKRKENEEVYMYKKHGVNKGDKTEDVAFMDYVPDKPLQSLIHSIVGQMIHSAIGLIDSASTSANPTGWAFDYQMLSRVLQVMIRESHVLIPFLARIRCSKDINEALANCSETTKKCVLSLLQKDPQKFDISFRGTLVRLIAILGFGRVDRLLFQMCLDTYVLAKIKNIFPVSVTIRWKVIECLRAQQSGDSVLEHFAQLWMILTLLDIREFSRLCVDHNILSLLHRLYLHLSSSTASPFFRKSQPILLNPCTILHQLNLEFNTFKQLKFVPKGKPTIDQLKEQLVQRTSLFPRSRFLDNWLYFGVGMRAEFDRAAEEAERDGDSSMDSDEEGSMLSLSIDSDASEPGGRVLMPDAILERDDDEEDLSGDDNLMDEESDMQGWTDELIISDGEAEQDISVDADVDFEDDMSSAILIQDSHPEDEEASMTDLFEDIFDDPTTNNR